MSNETQLKEITKEELNEKLQSKRPFQLLNVLAPEDYKLGVIRGSRKIPLSELPKRFGELDSSKDVVVYCAGGQCEASHKAAELLAAEGFTVSVYKGGAKEWVQAGLPVEKSSENTSGKKDHVRSESKESVSRR